MILAYSQALGIGQRHLELTGQTIHSHGVLLQNLL
jgi:hypothetical protein